MVGSSNPAGGDLRRGGEAASAEPCPDGSVGSSVHRYAPMCILWSVVLWFNANVFMRFDLWFALLFFLFHTVPLALLLHFPDLLEVLDRPVAPQPSPRPAAQEEEDDDHEEYAIVHDHDAKAA